MKTANKSRPPASLPLEVINELKEANLVLHEKNKSAALHEDLIAIKKQRNNRDKALRPLFLNLGMALSILFAIIAINWKVYSNAELVDLGQVESDVSEIIEIPISKQPPPPPPKQEVFKIAEVKDTEIIEELEVALDVDVTADEALEEIEFIPQVEEEEEVVEEIFVIVEQEPLPQGGLDEFYRYLASELKYPAAAARLNVSGTVFVQFVIEKDGSITNVEVAKGIGAGCDEEAIRVIQNAPKWNPGKQRGVPVRVRKIIPVRFILHQG